MSPNGVTRSEWVNSSCEIKASDIVIIDLVRGNYYYHTVSVQCQSIAETVAVDLVSIIIMEISTESMLFLYPPYPKDRGMLWFYVEAARRPPSAARRPPPAMVLTR